MRVLALAMVLVTATHSRAQVYDDPETEEALKALEGGEDQPPPDGPDEGQPDPPPEAPPSPPRLPGLALRPGQVNITITAEASLSKGTAFEPTSIAPDVSYGATDRVTVSVVHSGAATTGFRGSAGGGICMTGSDRGCPKLYNNVGAEALVDVLRGNAMAALVIGVHALSFEPLFIDAKIGAQTSLRSGKLVATFSPSVMIGITDRDAGNEGSYFLPASLGAQVAKPLFVAIGGGVAGPFVDSEAWTARLGVIVRTRVARGTFVAASMFLPKLAGGDSVMGTGADARNANLWLVYLR